MTFTNSMNEAFRVDAEYGTSNVALFVSDSTQSTLFLSTSNQDISTVITSISTDNGQQISQLGHFNIDTSQLFPHIELYDSNHIVMNDTVFMKDLYVESNIFVNDTLISTGWTDCNVNTCNLNYIVSVDRPVGVLMDNIHNTNAALYVGGNEEISGGIVTKYDLHNVSDISFKTNIQSISTPLDILTQMRGVYYNRKDEKNSNKRHVGVIAQEIEKVLPEVVSISGGIKTVSYGNIVALLIECIKENNKEIQLLKEQIIHV